MAAAAWLASDGLAGVKNQVVTRGRYLPIVASVALAGALARGPVRPATSGTLPTRGITFGIVLLGVIALVGGMTFLPAPVLGPLAEAL